MDKDDRLSPVCWGWGDRTARELVQPLPNLPDYDLIIKYQMGRDEGGDE
jgi:hypothetical protein